MARMALDHAKGIVEANVKREFIGRTGSRFTGEIKQVIEYGGKKAVLVEVCGSAHYTGSASYQLEDTDELGRGFLIR